MICVIFKLLDFSNILFMVDAHYMQFNKFILFGLLSKNQKKYTRCRFGPKVTCTLMY